MHSGERELEVRDDSACDDLGSSVLKVLTSGIHQTIGNVCVITLLQRVELQGPPWRRTRYGTKGPPTPGPSPCLLTVQESRQAHNRVECILSYSPPVLPAAQDPVARKAHRYARGLNEEFNAGGYYMDPATVRAHRLCCRSRRCRLEYRRGYQHLGTSPPPLHRRRCVQECFVRCCVQVQLSERISAGGYAVVYTAKHTGSDVLPEGTQVRCEPRRCPIQTAGHSARGILAATISAAPHPPRSPHMSTR